MNPIALKNIPSVGEKTEEALSRLGIFNVWGLLFHKPARFSFKKYNPELKDIQHGDNVILEVEIIDFADNRGARAKKKVFKVTVSYKQVFINLVYFNFFPFHITKRFSRGSKIVISGKVEIVSKLINIPHPEAVEDIKDASKLEKISVIYPLTYGLTSPQLRKYVEYAFTHLPNFEEWIPPALMAKYNWPSFVEALKKLHYPDGVSNYDMLADPFAHIESDHFYKRLIYDELLANQLSLALIRKFEMENQGNRLDFKGEIRKRIEDLLPFTLTDGQNNILAEIEREQKSAKHMMRLLQGDVGSGKTVVSLLAMANSVECNKQACLMAPTDLLAMQHYEWISKTANFLRVGLLTGRVKGKKREALLEQLKNGEIDILIGTHAIFQDNVEFKDLSLIVIDEQHKFGVKQRLSLAAKGNRPDLLVMSATPIPRTLALTYYGDMDISKLTDKPKGRLPIITSNIPDEKEYMVLDSIRKMIEKGQQVYWVCPAIENKIEVEGEEIEQENIAAAVKRYEKLQEVFPGQVSLVHGKMPNADKDKAMQDFASNTTQILVATTVIEVGIDVKNASIIVIENAERFGLAQLHQLRGRVGRSDLQSYCILLYSKRISKIGFERLKVMKSTNDGFIIAEADLKLRGAGDIIGTKQSGAMMLKFADIARDVDLIEHACTVATSIVTNDPYFTHPASLKYKQLLDVFEYNETMENVFA